MNIGKKRVMLVLGIIFIYIVGCFVATREIKPEIAGHSQAPAIQYAENLITESLVSEVKAAPMHTVGLPTRLVMPTANVEANIIPVGVTSEGNLDVPPNYVEVGWYRMGTLPGEIGSAVLDGHVDDGAGLDGVFKHLRDVKIGDTFTVLDSMGTEIRFKVVDSSVYKTDAFPGEKIFHEFDGAMVKIITCHGKWMPHRKTYDERLVVTGVRI